jgi:hypothetical protein
MSSERRADPSTSISLTAGLRFSLAPVVAGVGKRVRGDPNLMVVPSALMFKTKVML